MERSSSVIKIVYSFFLGVLIALFVGLGINTFYPAPEQPEYPPELSYTYEGKEQTEEFAQRQREYDTKMEAFQEEQLQPYNRNVSIITLGVAVILLAVSLIFERKIRILADGILLGGLFTLLYSLIRGLTSQDSRYTFVMVTVGLGLVIYLGYHKFVKDGHKKATVDTK